MLDLSNFMSTIAMKRKAEQAVPGVIRNIKDSHNKAESKFIRSFDHVDGNWPSHIFLSGTVPITGVSVVHH